MQTQSLAAGRTRQVLCFGHATQPQRVQRRSSRIAAATRSQDGSFEESVSKAGQVAQSKLRQLADQASDSAQRTWRKLDSQYSLKDKAERAARRLEEQARDVDQTWSVRRKVRNSVEHVQRMWPVWSKKLDAFAATWYGKTTVLAALFLIMSSPIFWRLLNFLLIIWWLAIPVAAALITSAQRKAAERAAAEAEEAARRQQNPFADIFRSRSGKAGGRGGGSASQQQAGPIIDADYTVLSKDDDK